MSLQEVVARALEQNPDLVLARLEERKIAHEVDIARDAFAPKLTVGSGLAYSSGFPLSIEGSAPSVFRADATATLFNRERRYMVEKAKEETRGAALDTQARMDEAAFRTADLALDAARSGLLLDLARRQVESLQRIASAVAARVAEGRELPVESKRAALNAARARQRVTLLELEQENTETRLAHTLGFAPQDRVRPLTEDRGALDRLPSSEEDAVAAALTASKEVRRLESSLLARSFEVRSARAAKLPRVDLVAQYGLFARFNNYEQFFRSFERHNGQIGVSVQVPVFAGSAARAREEQAEAEIAKLRVQLTTARNRIAVVVRQAFQEVRKAEASNEVARLDLDLARDLVSIQLAQMDEGRSSMEKLEEARFVENEKWIAFYDARWALDRARLEVSHQTGTLLAVLR